MPKYDREPVAWITRGGKHIPIFDSEDNYSEKDAIAKTKELAKQYGFSEDEVNGISIKELKGKWGEYNVGTGLITFDKGILKLPKPLADYVISHELMHISYPNHGGMFQMVLTAHMPDWKDRENKLKRFAGKKL